MKTKRFINFILTAISLSILIACSGIYEDGKEIAAESKKIIKQIPVEEFNSMIENAADFLLIDCRQRKEYTSGNIPGSFNIPRGELEFKILDDLYWEEEFMYTPLKTDTIIIYCKSGARGSLATISLMQLGFENVYNLDGGWKAYNGGNEPEPITTTSGGCGE